MTRHVIDENIGVVERRGMLGRQCPGQKYVATEQKGVNYIKTADYQRMNHDGMNKLIPIEILICKISNGMKNAIIII